MNKLEILEGKIIDSVKEDFDGVNSYFIIKFRGGGKINIVSYLNGDEGTAQLSIDIGKNNENEIIGKKITKITEEFDGEQDYLKIYLDDGSMIHITAFSSDEESTASLDVNVYANNKIVAESLEENMYRKRGEYPLSQPQYEDEETDLEDEDK